MGRPDSFAHRMTSVTLSARPYSMACSSRRSGVSPSSASKEAAPASRRARSTAASFERAASRQSSKSVEVISRATGAMKRTPTYTRVGMLTANRAMGMAMSAPSFLPRARRAPVRTAKTIEMMQAMMNTAAAPKNAPAMTKPRPVSASIMKSTEHPPMVTSSCSTRQRDAGTVSPSASQV